MIADVLILLTIPHHQSTVILDLLIIFTCAVIDLWQARVEEPEEAQEWQTREESGEEAERRSQGERPEEGQERLPPQEPSQEPKETQEPSLSIEKPHLVIL